jgi:colicin import membrane protein
MAQKSIAVRADAVFGELAGEGSFGAGRAWLVAAFLVSATLHGLALASLGVLDFGAERAATARIVPVEVVFEAAAQIVPEPARFESQALDRTGETSGRIVAAGSAQRAEARAAPPLMAGVPVPVEGQPVSSSAMPEAISAAAALAPAPRGEAATRYDLAVLARLDRAKHYPEHALRRRARGTAVVGFALDATGRVTVATLLRSSGDRDLDDASLAVVRRAAPFPEPPPGARRNFAVDIAFGMASRDRGEGWDAKRFSRDGLRSRVPAL